MVEKNTKTGKFQKQLQVWNLDLWNEGWQDKGGRFWVYRPDYPKAYVGGYALRTHVVWWIYNHSVVPVGFDIHHINKIRNDDKIENLELLEHKAHANFHKQQTIKNIDITCRNCGKIFKVKPWEIKQSKKEGWEIKFCSQQCYNSSPRTETHKKKIGEGLRKAVREGRRIYKKGYKLSEEHKRKISEGFKNRKKD